MARLVAGNNMSAFAYESGTYASISGASHWPGLVQNFTPEDSEGVQRIRYHGTSNRNIAKQIPGARDYGGTIEQYPQHLKFLGFALGSIVDATTGSPAYFTHTLKELNSGDMQAYTSGVENPFVSFTFENSQVFATGQNFVRTYKGCVVDEYSLEKAGNNEPLVETIKFVAKEMNPTSGAVTLGVPTELTNRPFIPSDVFVHYPSGTKLNVNTWKLSLKNSFDTEKAHVASGSREITTPTATERSYTIECSMPAESSQAARLYGLFKSGGNATENCAIEIRNFGLAASGVSFITGSNADMIMQAPSPLEGINSWTLTLYPRNVSAVVQDRVLKYAPW